MSGAISGPEFGHCLIVWQMNKFSQNRSTGQVHISTHATRDTLCRWAVFLDNLLDFRGMTTLQGFPDNKDFGPHVSHMKVAILIILLKQRC